MHRGRPGAARSIRGGFAASASVLLCLLLLAGCSHSAQLPAAGSAPSSAAASSAGAVAVGPVDAPDYFGEDYVELNGGVPSFSAEDRAAADGTEIYGELDSLGRATGAFAKLCGNTRPKAGSVRDVDMPDPTGFVQAYYPEAGIDHLYERSHLIAYSLSDEAVNPRDLVTGTQHLNQSTMGDFERAIRSCIALADEAGGHGNHVLMRVTPDFRGTELVARGVQIEALSVEDGGESVCLNVYCYNVQPGVAIDYATGESRLECDSEAPPAAEEEERTYVLNANTKRFHDPDCASAGDMKPENRRVVTAKRSDLASQGYRPCSRCNP